MRWCNVDVEQKEVDYFSIKEHPDNVYFSYITAS